MPDTYAEAEIALTFNSLLVGHNPMVSKDVEAIYKTFRELEPIIVDIGGLVKCTVYPIQVCVHGEKVTFDLGPRR